MDPRTVYLKASAGAQPGDPGGLIDDQAGEALRAWGGNPLLLRCGCFASDGTPVDLGDIDSLVLKGKAAPNAAANLISETILFADLEAATITGGGWAARTEYHAEFSLADAIAIKGASQRVWLVLYAVQDGAEIVLGAGWATWYADGTGGPDPTPADPDGDARWVRHDGEQALTDEAKAQARENIGAAASAGSGIGSGYAALNPEAASTETLTAINGIKTWRFSQGGSRDFTTGLQIATGAAAEGSKVCVWIEWGVGDSGSVVLKKPGGQTIVSAGANEAAEHAYMESTYDGSNWQLTRFWRGISGDLTNHLEDTANPHEVNKAQVGLGNADNTADADKPVSTAQQAALDLKADAADLSAHTSDTDNPHSVTKAQVGLGNADNTADADKPVSTAAQAALDAKADLVGGKVPTSQIPEVAITEYLGEAADQTAMLALDGQYGDWCVRTDDGKVYVITGPDPSDAGDWTAINYPASPVTSVAGKTGAVTLAKGDVGLGNADNTSDANKPVSTAQQAALDAKADDSALSSHTGNTSNPHGVTKTQVGLGNADNTADADKPVSTAQQAALNGKAKICTLNAQSGTTYALQASDSGKVIRCTNAAGCTVTVPASLALTEPVTLIGTQGAVVLTASSTTLNTESGYDPESRAAFAAIQILPTGTADTYDVIGGLAAA